MQVCQHINPCMHEYLTQGEEPIQTDEWNEPNEPNRHHVVPFIGLAYDVMMMSYMTSWVFICDVTIRMSCYNVANGVHVP